MTDKLTTIKMLLVGLAEYYKTSLTNNQLLMYAEDLEDLPIEQIGEAIKRIRRNPTQQFFPLPAILRQEIIGNEKDDAVEAANRIVEAMAKFGSYDANNKARAFIGELGWQVVIREGGWENVCKNSDNDKLTSLKAQWRELAKSLRTKSVRGILDEPVGLLPLDMCKKQNLLEHTDE